MTAPISNRPTTTRLHHYAGRYFGCVPAYDRFFEEGAKYLGLEKKSYNEDSLLELAKFYEAHNDRLEEARRGMRVGDLIYPQMKLLDMGLWQIGFERDAGDAK